MLPQVRINAPFERASFPHHIPLTLVVAGVPKPIPTPSRFPGDASFSENVEEACDYCDSRAVEEVVSFTGDEERIEFLCAKCWLMGFSPEVEEVAA